MSTKTYSYALTQAPRFPHRSSRCNDCKGNRTWGSSLGDSNWTHWTQVGGVWKIEEKREETLVTKVILRWLGCFLIGVSVVWDEFSYQDLDPVIHLMTNTSNSFGSVDPSELIRILIEDEVENTGVQLIRQASAKTNDVAGDGTTWPGFPGRWQGVSDKNRGILPPKMDGLCEINGKTPIF